MYLNVLQIKMGQVSQRLELYIAHANELSLNPSMTHNCP